MKVAFVGTSVKLTDNEDRDIRQFVSLILKDFPLDTIIISGGAKGVDSISLEIAKSLGYTTVVYEPINKTWTSFKERNLIIAQECDQLFCLSVPVHKTRCYHHFVPQNHEKTAGCWTMKQAEKLGKQTRLLVMPSR